MPLFSNPPKEICVLRLSAIGDVCNTIAAVQAIQSQWPATRITWIAGKSEANLLRLLPGIEILVFDKKAGIKGYLDIWRQLSGRRFDALLHMQYAIRASILTLGIKARYKLGFDKARSQDLQHLFTNVAVPSPKSPHVLDGLMAFTEALGIKRSKPKWALRCSSDDNRWAQSHLSDSSRNLVIVPAASKSYKNWSNNGYSELVLHAQNKGWHVILAGSPDQTEVDKAKQVQQLLPEKALNLVGKSTLTQMLALMDKADLVIAPDTGPAHMANAMNTPVIGLYAHHNPERTGPYNYRKYVVSVWKQAIEKETGVSADSLPWRARVKDKLAMQQIEAHDVIAMFDKVCQEESL